MGFGEAEGDPPARDDAAGYPAHWEADVVLRDGSTAHLRPITPEDADRLQRFHLGQSAESVYFRFFAPMPRLSEADLHRFTHVDHVDRVALVCVLGSEIVGVGRYERVDATHAEVAFNIGDSHQGRGVGSVLLEHLAAAARENGVRTFQAEVLPHNHKMLAVFRDAGFEIRRAYDDGVVSLHFDIDPTERSRAVMEAREHRAEARSMQVLLNPRSVVVIGAGPGPGRLAAAARRLVHGLVGAGFTGTVHAVGGLGDDGDPPAATAAVVTVERLAQLAEPVDLAVVAVPADQVPEVVRECAQHGVRGLVVVSTGFAEIGPQGTARQRELVSLARSLGMRVVGPHSWGIVNAAPRIRLDATLGGTLPQPGRLGLFCQSAALSAGVLDAARQRNLGISTFVSAGNRADVSGNDCLQYWEEDPDTEVIGLYLESIGNPRKFSRIARRLARSKPVIVVKSGSSGYGVPPGHAVRPTGVPPQAFGSMLRQSGCIRVENVPQLLDVAQLLLSQPLPAGNRVAVLATSHTVATLLADACASWQLEITRGPLAGSELADAERFAAALAAALADPRVDAVVAAYVPALAGPQQQDAALASIALAQSGAGATKPVVACLLGLAGAVTGHLAADRATTDHPVPDPVGRHPVPTYPTPEEAVRALAAVTRYADWRRREPGPRVDPPGRDRERAEALIAQILAAHPDGVELDQEQVTALLAAHGITLWPQLRVTDAAEAVTAADRLGWPVALKAEAAHLRNRIDLGAVHLDLAGPEELVEHLGQLRARLGEGPAGALVVQAMAPPGVACVVRSVEDPLFGPVVSFGLGGDAIDLLGDIAHRIPPFTELDVTELIRSVRAAPKLFGHRGAAPADVAALEDVVARVSCLADEHPEVAALELNPVVVSTHGAAVLGASIRLAPAALRMDAERRELFAQAPQAAPSPGPDGG